MRRPCGSSRLRRRCRCARHRPAGLQRVRPAPMRADDLQRVPARPVHPGGPISDRAGSAPDHRKHRTSDDRRRRRRRCRDRRDASSIALPTCSPRCVRAGCRRHGRGARRAWRCRCGSRFKRTGEIIGTPRVTYTTPDTPPTYATAITRHHRGARTLHPDALHARAGRRGRRPADRDPLSSTTAASRDG